VFVDDHGAPQRYDAILEDFQQACKRAKIVDGFTDSNNGTRLPGFHNLRRTFARVANCAGVPHGIIMEIAGWKSEAMLLLYRGNSQPAEQRAAFKRLASGV
jgi:integrase